MRLKLDKSRAICPQLCQQLCASIAAGDSKPGQRLMSVRDIALAAGVNPNTVQHAFQQLEEKGVLYSQRGSGWFIAEDTAIACQLHSEAVKEKMAEFFREMAQMGVSPEEVKSMVKEWENV